MTVDLSVVAGPSGELVQEERRPKELKQQLAPKDG